MARVTRRKFWTTAALSCLGGVLLLPMAGSLLFPEPPRASGAALMRWIVLRDLRYQPRETVRQIVDRLQYSVDPATLATSSSEAGSSRIGRWLVPRIERNVELLQRVWFETRAVQYHRCSYEARMVFMQQQVTALLDWSAALSSGHSAEQTGASGTAVRDFFGRIERWIQAAPTDLRSSMQQAVTDAVLCWLAITKVSDLPDDTQQQLAVRFADELTAKAEAPATADVPSHHSSSQHSSSQHSSSQHTSPGTSQHSLQTSDLFTRLPLTPSQHQQLQANIRQLVEAWVLAQAEQFQQLPAEQRNAFVDQRLELLERLDLGRFLTPASAPAAADRSSRLLQPAQALTLVALAAEAVHRAQQLPSPEREQVLRLLAHVQQRLLVRSLPDFGSWLPGAQD